MQKIKGLLNICVLLFIVLPNTLYSREHVDLRLALMSPEKVDSLDLSFQEIQQFEDWNKFTNLSSLKLNYCQLTSLPVGLRNLTSLTSIELNGNIFSNSLETFSIISEFKKLTHLSLNNCYLFFIPNSIKKLVYLEELFLVNNHLDKLPLSLNKLAYLKELDLAQNNLDTLGIQLLYLHQLERLDLSFNPEISKVHSIQLISALPSIKHLSFQGWDSIPAEISYLKQVESLDISNGSFTSLPESIGEMSSLKELKLKSQYLNWGKVFESLSYSKTCSQLEIGGCSLNAIPFNIFKLKSVRKLIISESNIERFPASLSRLKIKSLEIKDSYLKNIGSLFSALSSSNSLQSINFKNNQIEKGNIQIRGLERLSQLSFHQCYLKDISDFNVKNALSTVNFTSCSLTDEQIKQWRENNPRAHFNWENKSSVQHQVKLDIPSLNIDKRMIRSTVYGEVGYLLDGLKSMVIDIPSDAFLDSLNRPVHGEIDVQYHLISTALDAVFSGLEMQTTTNGKSYQQIQPYVMIKLVAFHEGRALSHNPDRPIHVSVYSNLKEQQLFYYHPIDGIMHIGESLSSDTVNCSDILSKEQDELDLAWRKRPIMEYQMRKSRVFLQLKKARKKRNFYYFLEPEYGFNENYLPLFGNKIKAYPEFRPYKKVRWNYVGDNQKDDFNAIYTLSDSDPKKIKRRSSFYLYVMSLNNISLSPSSTDDYYEMEFSRGFDTLKLNVMPQIGITKPEKIQKWHRKKFLKYVELLQNRKYKWSELDSIHLVKSEEFERHLNDYRTSILQNSKLSKASSNPKKQTFKIEKSAYYMIGKFHSKSPKFCKVSSVVDLKGTSIKINHFYSMTLDGENLIQSNSDGYYVQPDKYTLVWSNLDGNKIAFSIVQGETIQLIFNTLSIRGLNHQEVIQILENYVEEYH